MPARAGRGVCKHNWRCGEAGERTHLREAVAEDEIFQDDDGEHARFPGARLGLHYQVCPKGWEVTHQEKRQVKYNYPRTAAEAAYRDGLQLNGRRAMKASLAEPSEHRLAEHELRKVNFALHGYVSCAPATHPSRTHLFKWGHTLNQITKLLGLTLP